jgi:fatty-acyl-CoA synthase
MSVPKSSMSFGYAYLLRRLEGSTYLQADREAVVFRDRRVTYGELHDGAARLADALKREGFQKGDRLAILLRNDPAWFDVFFAVAALGGVLVPVNYLLRASEIAFILNDSEATVLVVGDDLCDVAGEALAEAQGCRRAFVVSNAGGDSGPGSAALHGARDLEGFKATGEPVLPEVDVDLHDPALLQYTSGTTGFPKGATHTVSSLLWNSFH